MIRVPKYKTIEHHCTEHPKIFKKWWEANKNKTKENVDDVPKCFALHELQRPLKEMIDLAQEILDGINKKNGEKLTQQKRWTENPKELERNQPPQQKN